MGLLDDDCPGDQTCCTACRSDSHCTSYCLRAEIEEGGGSAEPLPGDAAKPTETTSLATGRRGRGPASPGRGRARLRVRRPHVLQRVLRPHGGGADCPRGECPDDLRDGRPEPPIQLKDRDSLPELVNGPGGATSYPAAVGHPSSWTEPPDQLEDHGFRTEFADVPSGATADSATVSPPGSWTEPPVLTSYSDEAGAQEAKARDSIVERLGRVVSLEVSRG